MLTRLVGKDLDYRIMWPPAHAELAFIKTNPASKVTLIKIWLIVILPSTT